MEENKEYRNELPVAGENNSKPKEFIDTVAGKAYFSHTEVENEYGQWNDEWWTPRYWVIHEGKYHHIYEVREEAKA